MPAIKEFAGMARSYKSNSQCSKRKDPVAGVFFIGLISNNI